MEFPNRGRAFLQGSPRRRSPKATRPAAATGGDENASPNHLVPVMAASPQRKKVLGQRNDGSVGGMERAASPPVQQPKPARSPPTLAGRGAGPYDPKTNYTTPRPAFLRYDPEGRREILLRVSRAAEEIQDDCSSTTSGDGDSLSSDAAAASPILSAPRSDSEAEVEDSEKEDEIVPARRGGWARRLFLLLICVCCCFCYLYCANPSTSLDHLYDRDRSSPGNLVAVTVMGLADICLDVPLGELTCQIGSEKSENVPDLREDSEMDKFDTEVAISFQNDKQNSEVNCLGGNPSSLDHGDRASPGNLVAVTVMGLADICMDVSLGELTCQIGSEKSENVADLREDSEIDKFNTEVPISFQNDKQSSEVPLDSIGYTSSHTDNKDGDSSEPVNQEEWEDCSSQCELQLVSIEKATTSESYKMKDRKGLESEELGQYENTAEAAKTIFSTVKFMWSTMEPHLLQILACLSFAGLVAALYQYYQRSRERCNCIRTCDSIAEEPLLVPHQVVQLSKTSSTQDAQVPVNSSEPPMQLTIPNQGPPDSLEVPIQLKMPRLGQLVSIEDPVQESLTKTGPLVTLKAPVIGQGIHSQKLKQGDPENILTSNSRFLNHSDADSSKPPVVELIGEFIFENSSRGRSTKRLNRNAGDATVLNDDVDKMHVHSSIVKSPSVRGAKEEQEKSTKGKKTDTTPTPLTPTPLRRSSRLRNKVTTP